VPAEWVSAIAEAITAVAALAAAAVAYWQLGEIASQTKIQGDRERQWQTIAACQRYLTDPVLIEAKRKILVARGYGTKSRVDDPQSITQEAIFILNYLDSITIGVRQGVYMKEIVKDNLQSVIVDAVSRFIENELGDFHIKKDHLGNLVALAQEFRVVIPDHRSVR
jgi:hypothetical protein